MQRLLSRILKTPALLNHASSTCIVPKRSFSTFSLQPNLQKLQERAIPGDFVRWGSLGFCRSLSFATGFSPLQHKPLDSIMEIQRVKDRSPEDIASAWDDVMSQFDSLLVHCICFFDCIVWLTMFVNFRSGNELNLRIILCRWNLVSIGVCLFVFIFVGLKVNHWVDIC